MTKPAKANKSRENGHLIRPRSGNRAHTAGLLSRLVPLIVLVIGATWLMTSMQPVSAQYPNRYPTTRTQNQPQFAPTFAPRTSAIPSASRLQPQPNAAVNTVPAIDAGATAPVAEAEASFWSGWKMPAIVQKIMAGGWLMLPLAFCSLVVFALSIERMVALRRGRVIPRPFVRRFTECVEDGQLSFEEANEICQEFDCPVSEVFRAALRRWGRPMLEIEQAVMDAGDRVADRLRRFLRVFHAISNVAPLIGLLGTVIGMIEAFDVISTQESIGRPEMLASGISTALMTTAGGLCVAIPAYLAYMYFSSKSDRYLNEIDKLCQRVVDSISAEALESSGSRSRKRRAA